MFDQMIADNVKRKMMFDVYVVYEQGAPRLYRKQVSEQCAEDYMSMGFELCCEPMNARWRYVAVLSGDAPPSFND